ncbi:MAG: DUF1080 domain-containing protein [Chloroflexi bacterium]|nr:DUF1080 domain-containing protein [Chloroflexota bacterium]
MESIRKILRTPSAFVLIITAIIALVGVIIQSKTNKEIALIPINATSTAEAKLTQIAFQPTEITLTESTPSTLTSDTFYEDNFSSDAPTWWSIDNVNNEYWSSSSYIDNGVFVWHVTSKTAVFASLLSKTPSLTNFDLELTLERVDNSQNSSYGVTFFATNGAGGYDLKFEPNKPKQFKLQKREGNTTTSLIDYTEASSMNLTGSNKIRIQVTGSNIKIFINGAFVGEVNDDAIRKGQIGLFAGLLEGETVILNVSDFKVATSTSQ